MIYIFPKKRAEMSKSKYKQKKKISLFALVSFVIFALTYILLVISKLSPSAADLLNGTLCHAFRSVMAKLGGIFPFSLYEVFMLSIPLLAVLLVILAVKSFKSGRGVRFIFDLLAITLLLISGHNLSLGIGYHTTPIDKKADLPQAEVTEDRLAAVMTELRDEVNMLCSEINYEDGVSSPDKSFEELNRLISDAYLKLEEKGYIPQSFDSTAKRVYFGNLMSYMGITGIYTFYTGDANVNSAYPMYDMIFTSAHELAHQRGISRENEANFIGYLATRESDDAYIRYAGALSMYEYIGNALYRTNKERYKEINAELSSLARGDILASYEVTQKYGDTFIADISSFVNDLFLKSNGTAGVVSYGRVVTLTVRYFENLNQ